MGAATGSPFVLKAHGSELEYAMRGDPALCAWARATIASAGAVVAGSEHVRRVLGEVVGPGSYQQRVGWCRPGWTSMNCGPSRARRPWHA